MKLIFTSLFLFFTATFAAAQNVESFGVFTGVTIPFTVDQGLHKDPRFYPKVVLKSSPIGFYYGYDKSGFGYAITPQYVKLGQTYTVHNVQGGQVGTRKIHMDYITVPVALKLHINDISFFRLSLVASIAPSILVAGSEVYNISASELKYPKGVTVPPAYSVSYDGVYVPYIKSQTYVSKDKFSIFQIFAAVGLRSDFDLNDKWSINFDGRLNFGILEPRTSKYVKTLKNPSTSTPDYQSYQDPNLPPQPGAPDLYGSRRDVYLSGQIGFCRIIESKENFNSKHSGSIRFKKKSVASKKKTKSKR